MRPNALHNLRKRVGDAAQIPKVTLNIFLVFFLLFRGNKLSSYIRPLPLQLERKKNKQTSSS